MRPICSENTEPRDITCEISVCLALTSLDLPLSITNLLVPSIISPISSWCDSLHSGNSLFPLACLHVHPSASFYWLPPSLSDGAM